MFNVSGSLDREARREENTRTDTHNIVVRDTAVHCTTLSCGIPQCTAASLIFRALGDPAPLYAPLRPAGPRQAPQRPVPPSEKHSQHSRRIRAPYVLRTKPRSRTEHMHTRTLTICLWSDWAAKCSAVMPLLSAAEGSVSPRASMFSTCTDTCV